MEATQSQKRIDACDVVIVGAGLVGAATAARMAQAGLKTALLEAREIAGGATGRSVGMALTGLAERYDWAVGAYGRERARKIWALTAQGRERLSEAAEQLDIACQHVGRLDLAVTDKDIQAMEESARLLQEDGFNVQFEANDPLARGFRAALRYPDDVSVDATALTRALITEHNIPVHERTEVYSLEAERIGGENGIRVWAHGRTVLCKNVVLTVNGYAPLINAYFADKIAPTRSLVFATEPLDRVILEQLCCVHYAGSQHMYCRQMPDRQLLVGGWRRSRPHSSEMEADENEEHSEAPLQQGLARLLSRHFPDAPPAKMDGARHWSGIMGLTTDGLPLLGRLPNLPGVYFALGLGGRGLAWALVLAERVAEAILKQADPTLERPVAPKSPTG